MIWSFGHARISKAIGLGLPSISLPRGNGFLRDLLDSDPDHRRSGQRAVSSIKPPLQGSESISQFVSRFKTANRASNPPLSPVLFPGTFNHPLALHGPNGNSLDQTVLRPHPNKPKTHLIAEVAYHREEPEGRGSRNPACDQITGWTHHGDTEFQGHDISFHRALRWLRITV